MALTMKLRLLSAILDAKLAHLEEVAEMLANSTGYITLLLILRVASTPLRLIPESAPRDLLELNKFGASFEISLCMRTFFTTKHPSYGST